MLTIIIGTMLIVPVFADLSNNQTKCSGFAVKEDCQPLTILDAQVLAGNMIGTAYALGGLLFLGILIYNGTIYLIGSWEEAKYILGASLEDIQKRMAQWGVGFFLFFLSYPIMNSILHNIIPPDSKCYGGFQSPVVMFVFPDVCDYVAQPSITPTSTATATVTAPLTPTPLTTPITATPPFTYNLLRCVGFSNQRPQASCKTLEQICGMACIAVDYSDKKAKPLVRTPLANLMDSCATWGMQSMWCTCSYVTAGGVSSWTGSCNGLTDY